MKRPLIRLCLFLFAAPVGGLLWLALYSINPSQGSGTVTVSIPRGAGIREISRLLDEKGLIRQDQRFFLLALLSGDGRKLKAGEFELPLGVTPREILRLLAQGKTVQYHITFPEGLTTGQMARLLAGAGWGEENEFLHLSRDAAFIKSLGLEQESLEGYLFPDTYSLVRGESDTRKLLEAMVRRFLAVHGQLGGGSTQLTQHQVVTLASIVEKETAHPGERPLIARVFFNRLDRGMRLQSDPTVIYGLPDFNGDLTRADLRRETPYNTYVIKGLPPGPICNPGRAALEAVYNPAASKALFFVARNDGTHQFSQTLEEHNKAVQLYQKKTGEAATP